MRPADVPVLDSARLRLRAAQIDDLSTTLEWRNDDRNRRHFLSTGAITYEQHESWFQQYCSRDDEYLWIIERRSRGDTIGQVSLYNVDREMGRGEIGRLLIGNFEARRKGYATEAIAAATRFSISELHLRETICIVRKSNLASQRTLVAAGYRPVAEHDDLVEMIFSDEA